MQLFTPLLSALALAASTTTASHIAARQGQPILFSSPDRTGVSTWPQGTNQSVTWSFSLDFWTGQVQGSSPVYAQLFLGNNKTANISHVPLLPKNSHVAHGMATVIVPNVPSLGGYYLLFCMSPGPISDYTDPSTQCRTPTFTIGQPPV